MEYIPQILVISFVPWLLNKYLKGTKIGNYLSPVVMAYVIGILIALFGLLPLSEAVSKNFSEISIMIAIPLLLFSANIRAWLKHAKSTVLSFFYAILAALISAVVFSFLFKDKLDEVWNQSGMLVGVFTGGTANMQAVGIGLGVSPETFAILNAAEILCGGIYLIFLTSVAHKVYGQFLPNYVYTEKEKEESIVSGEIKTKNVLIAIALSIGILALTFGIAMLVTLILPSDNIPDGSLLARTMKKTTLIILVLTTLAVISSFFRRIRKLEGSFEAGDYLLLVFSIAIGMRSNFAELLSTGGTIILYTAGCMLLTVLIHLVLSKISKVDRDTTIITSTAAIYGPAFIGQIATVMKNRQIVFAGMATGLVGYAVGNYLGISISYILESFLTK